MTDIVYDGRVYPSSEHAFQAAKSDDPRIKETIRQAKTPGKSKQLGRECKCRSDWDCVKEDIMLDILRLKFGEPILRKLLLSTRTYELIEGNYWHDNYWGVCACDACPGAGRNALGELLMKLRYELRESS